jgi:hypothetical protein
MKRALLMALLAGCSSSGYYDVPPCALNECPIDSDVSLAVEVRSPSSTTGPATLPETDIATVGFDLVNENFIAIVNAPVKVTGQVLTRAMGPAHIAKGFIIATRPSRIAGRPDRSYTAPIDPTTGDFSLLLPKSLPDEKYTLRVDSSVESLPPQFYEAVFDADTQFEFRLEDPAELLQIKGTVKNPNNLAIAGLKVAGMDPVAERVITTVATTDVNGAYAISFVRKLVGAGNTVQLQVTPGTTAPKGLPILSTMVDVSNTPVSKQFTVDLQSPPLPTPTRLIYPVLGNDQPIAGAHCLFEATVSKAPSTVTAVHRVLVDTDMSGYATVDLIPDEGGNSRPYQVTIAPPAGSDFQSASIVVSAGYSPGVTAGVRLERRPLLSGRTLDMQGRSVSGVLVQPGASSLAQLANASPLADLVPSSTATTDASGIFQVRVDPGRYDLAFIPLVLSKLPRRWIDAEQISGDRAMGDILLPPGTMSRIFVRSDRGAPLSGYDMTVFRIPAQNRTCTVDQLECLVPPRLIAEGRTASDGSLDVLLPAMVTKPAGYR